MESSAVQSTWMTLDMLKRRHVGSSMSTLAETVQNMLTEGLYMRPKQADELEQKLLAFAEAHPLAIRRSSPELLAAASEIVNWLKELNA